MKYEINEKNEITFFPDDPSAGFRIVQPTYPNGTSFETREGAEAWAPYFIDFLADETAPFPPEGAGKEPQPRRKVEDDVNYEFDAAAGEWVAIEPIADTPAEEETNAIDA